MIERTLKELNYIVYDWEEHLVIQTNDYEKALKEYERCKAAWEEYVNRDGEFSENEKVVLAVVLKDLHSAPIEEKDESGDNYWSFYEDTYDVSVTLNKNYSDPFPTTKIDVNVGDTVLVNEIPYIVKEKSHFE